MITLSELVATSMSPKYLTGRKLTMIMGMKQTVIQTPALTGLQ